MTAKLETLQEQLTELTVNELLSLQEQITRQLRRKLKTSNGKTKAKTPENKEVLLLDLIPGAYRMTDEDVKRHLLAVFTEEELAASKARQFDPSKLPPLPKPIWEYISEDREDRPLPQLLKGSELE